MIWNDTKRNAALMKKSFQVFFSKETPFRRTGTAKPSQVKKPEKKPTAIDASETLDPFHRKPK